MDTNGAILMSTQRNAQHCWNDIRDRVELIGLALGVVCLFVAVTDPATAQQKSVVSEQKFPRNHFMSALVARSGETRTFAIDRIEREYSDDPQAATTAMKALDRIEGIPQQRAAAIDLVHFLTRMEHPKVPPHL